MPYSVVDGASSSVQETQHALMNQTELEAPSTLNEPANLRLVLTKAAELRGVSEETLAERFFSWSVAEA